MSYFNGPADPHDFDEEFEANPSAGDKRSKRNIGILLLLVGLVGTTFTANISIGTGKKEFGQGIFQIKACDQWVGVGLTSGQGSQNTYVANVDFYGLDPRACKNTIFRIKFYPSGSNAVMNMYKGAGPTSSLSDSVTATSLVLKTTSTTYSGANQAAYDAWAYDAVTLIDPQGRDVGYADDYEVIEYTAATGIYSVVLIYPMAVATEVSSVTIETAKYS